MPEAKIANPSWGGRRVPLPKAAFNRGHGRMGVYEMPDGTVLHLVVADESDESDNLTPEEREVLHQALRAAWQSAEAGRLVSADDVLARLRAR